MGASCHLFRGNEVINLSLLNLMFAIIFDAHYSKRERFARDLVKSDIEVLCEMIYKHGEKYKDGTAAINFEDLLQV